MTEKKVTISIPEGLTAKTATPIIEKANEFACSIIVESNDRRINCKSLLGMLSLGLKCGDTIVLHAEGEKEEAALDAVAATM